MKRPRALADEALEQAQKTGNPAFLARLSKTGLSQSQLHALGPHLRARGLDLVLHTQRAVIDEQEPFKLMPEPGHVVIQKRWSFGFTLNNPVPSNLAAPA